MDRVDGRGLTGVSETTLWTLHNRATEAARPDGLLHDPLAVALYTAIDYPYREHFGRPNQTHALRALAVDAAIRDFLTGAPDGVVVSLGEGLHTTFWRLNEPSLRYVAVDIPPDMNPRSGPPRNPRPRRLRATDRLPRHQV